MLVTIIIAMGVMGVLALGYMALSGPSASKAVKRRLELLKERHGDTMAANAQAQIRKLLAARNTKIDGIMATLVPKPALLRKRLDQTGKNISLGKYAMVSCGVLVVIGTVVAALAVPSFVRYRLARTP